MAAAGTTATTTAGSPAMTTAGSPAMTTAGSPAMTSAGTSAMTAAGTAGPATAGTAAPMMNAGTNATAGSAGAQTTAGMAAMAGGAGGAGAGGMGAAGTGSTALPPCPSGYKCANPAQALMDMLLDGKVTDQDGKAVPYACGRMDDTPEDCNPADPKTSCPNLPNAFCAHISVTGLAELDSCGQLCTP
jgi:hypothetical protein